MTRSEFFDYVTDFEKLFDACSDLGCEHIVEDIHPESEFDEWFWSDVENRRSTWYWYELRDAIENMEGPSGEYFRITGTLEYEDIIESDLEDYIDQVSDYADRNFLWEEDENEEDSQDDLGMIIATDVDLAVLIGG